MRAASALLVCPHCGAFRPQLGESAERYRRAAACNHGEIVLPGSMRCQGGTCMYRGGSAGLPQPPRSDQSLAADPLPCAPVP